MSSSLPIEDASATLPPPVSGASVPGYMISREGVCGVSYKGFCEATSLSLFSPTRVTRVTRVLFFTGTGGGKVLL